MESTLRLTELVDKLEKAPQNADKAAVEKELSEIEALLKSINNDRGQVLADRYNSVVGEVRQVLADPSDNNLNNMIEGFNGYIDTYNSTTPDQSTLNNQIANECVRVKKQSSFGSSVFLLILF